MTVRTYKVKATIEKEMVVIVDDSIINEGWFKDFSSYMFQVEGNEELLEHVAHCVLVNDDNFCEGVGPLSWMDSVKNLKESGVAVSKHDTYTEFEVEEVKK